MRDVNQTRQQVVELSKALEREAHRVARWAITCLIFALATSALVAASIAFLVVALFAWFFAWTRWRQWRFLVAYLPRPDQNQYAWLHKAVAGLQNPPSWYKLSKQLAGSLEEPLVSVPEGWTDDMTIQIAPGHTLDQLVDSVLQAVKRRDDYSKTIAALVKDFGVSEEDAALALDRACGGVVRAATGNPHNCPDQQKDPIAWLSYHRCLREPSITAAIYPQFSSANRIENRLRDMFLYIAIALAIAIFIVWLVGYVSSHGLH